MGSDRGKTMLSTRLAVLVLSITSLCAFGCGSTVRGTSTGMSSKRSSVAFSHTDLVAKANAICKELQTRLRAVASPGTGDAGQIYLRASSYEESALRELEKLKPPADLAADWKAILVGFSTLAKDSAAYANYTKGKDLRGGRRLANSYLPVKHLAMSAAKRDGATECATVL
jgi:hypothetical protein